MDPKLELAAAWTSLIALYIYADFLSLYQLLVARNGLRGLM